MVDPAFADFLDSDDDEFFLEASGHILETDLNWKCTSTSKENVPQSLSGINTSRFFKSPKVCLPDKQDVFNISEKQPNASKYTIATIKEDMQNLPKASISNYLKSEATTSSNMQNASDISTKSLNAFKNYDKSYNHTTVFSCNIQEDGSKSLNKSKDYNDEITLLNRNATNKLDKACEDEAIITTSSLCNISNETIQTENSFKMSTPSNSSYINSRFTPGFTPKAKKRKLLGPAGFLEFFDGPKVAPVENIDERLSMDMELQNIGNSQYTPEHLSLPSWQKLQTAVSSCPNLHSTAKYYSIQRVLSESTKKKLPKHMVVPILCVLLKKLCTKDSTVISIFMDDTGEIKGKIDAEVLLKYKEFLVEGTALILKKVTFLCNVLILKDQNLVSLYHSNGTEKHPQSLESVLEVSEPLKPINCKCLKSTHLQKHALTLKTDCDTPNHRVLTCVTHSQGRQNSISYQNKLKNNSVSQNNTPKHCESSKLAESKIGYDISQNNSIDKSVAISRQTLPVIETSVTQKNIRSDAFLEKLLDEDNDMDEFDELLGSLDEKSFENHEI